MFLEQFVLEGLGHASYLLGSEQTGDAIVFDPQRDVACYFEAARARGMRIRHAMDSHGHNDYLSGLTEIATRTDVELWGSSYGDLSYAHRSLRDGEQIEVGEIGIEVMHTPGHTPEHVSLLVYDRDASADEPALLLSGGALLVGDLARPDLLGGREQAEAAARDFCHAIQEKLLPLPDHVEVFPTHVSGSLCGGSIGSRMSTTVGYERRANAILAKVSSQAEFVDQCLRLDNLPAVPPYWRRMRSQNMAGVATLGTLREPPALSMDAFRRAVGDGAVVLDTRSPEAFAGGHIPGALSVAFGTSFATWAGTVLQEGDAVVLVLDDPQQLWPVVWDLLRTGYDVPVGWLGGGMMTWRTGGGEVASLVGMAPRDVWARLERGDVDLLDVRQPGEWAEGHAPGATFITGAELPRRLEEVSSGSRPLAVVCGSGYRSTVSASVLARQGGRPLVNTIGGMAAWRAAGLPTVAGS